MRSPTRAGYRPDHARARAHVVVTPDEAALAPQTLAAHRPSVSATQGALERADAEAWERATDDDWLDGRVNQMDKGPFWGCSMSVPASDGNSQGPYAAKGIVLRVGDEGEAAVLFDRGLLQMAAAWTGGYQIPDRRFGLIAHPQMTGAPVFLADSRRNAHFRSSASTRWVSTFSRMARIKPGKPAPLPKSVTALTSLGTKGAS